MSEKVTVGYGTCPVCVRLKHVHLDATLRLHNSYSARGTVVVAQRCAGSGELSMEGGRAESA
ncbi:hypothetical protein [Pseudonocardia ailaonensis]|uniref:hypothetical protein n=1 Tax=Pseudonocardia ailaonensis TaxID=367279 RepID=UPI0031D3A527